MTTAITMLDNLLSRYRYGECIEYTDLVTLRAAMEQPGVGVAYWGQPDACGNIVDGIPTFDKETGHKGWTDEYKVPLYTAPQPAQQAEADKLLRQALVALESCVGDSLLGGAKRATVMPAIRKHLGEE